MTDEASGASGALDLESAWRLAGSDGDGRDQAVTINRRESGWERMSSAT